MLGVAYVRALRDEAAVSERLHTHRVVLVLKEDALHFLRQLPDPLQHRARNQQTEPNAHPHLEHPAPA